MVDPKHPRLGIVRQCARVSIGRSSFYYKGKGESSLNLALSSQFTSLAFTQVLKDAGVKISMDGKGRWMDNRASHPPELPTWWASSSGHGVR
jgi:hypothetical protein